MNTAIDALLSAISAKIGAIIAILEVLDGMVYLDIRLVKKIF
ncbi:hypothetical protein GARC_0452 [Paraglaciecola arctica BSs20135]|uniref:Uncharacterized protein n=1 Tax=Paraglaciecola arctica BSs20135 TaxID=493475 RepID=K6X9Z0_9ALTE|nr:hypothetical protein GARC_0452 [Paraglaciecola arctica BSs20135]